MGGSNSRAFCLLFLAGESGMSEVPAASGMPTAAPSKVTEPQSAPVFLELPFILVTTPPPGDGSQLKI